MQIFIHKWYINADQHHSMLIIPPTKIDPQCFIILYTMTFHILYSIHHDGLLNIVTLIAEELLGAPPKQRQSAAYVILTLTYCVKYNTCKIYFMHKLHCKSLIHCKWTMAYVAITD